MTCLIFVILLGREKQLADLGLDLGSDVSSVSDPDGLSASFDLPDGMFLLVEM